MADPSTVEVWRPWVVAPASGFEVRDPEGAVGLVQITDSRFLATRPFRFGDDRVEQLLVDRLRRGGTPGDEARRAVDDARTFTPQVENPTDLASIPRFLRWFENPYGVHTLAAIIHDDLITDEPNAGALGSDILADRFFREMLRRAGVGWLKRWIMWAGVALRTRWAAGGARRASVLAWLVLATAGIAAFAWAVGSLRWGWSSSAAGWSLLALSLVLPVGAAGLWGRQYGAALVAAVAAAWVLPAAAFAVFGYLVYLGLEGIARRIGLR